MSGEAMAAPAISVITPVYGRQGELDAALRMLALQTFRDFEAVIVDDASPEPLHVRTGEALGLRVRLIRAPANGGANRARNLGLEAALGGHVAYLDSDDLWLPQKLERQYRALEALPEADREGAIISCRSYVRGEWETYVRPAAHACGFYESPVEALFAPGALTQTSTLFLRTALARRLRFDETIATHDEPDLVLRAYRAGARVLMLSDALSVWDDRLRPGRFSLAKIAATDAWWARVEADIPPAALKGWRLADRVQALRARETPLAPAFRELAAEFGVLAALKALARLAAPRAYRRAQERRFARNPAHRADGPLRDEVAQLLRAVEAV